MIYIRYFAVRDENGEFIGTLEVTQDITKIKELEGEKNVLKFSLIPGCSSKPTTHYIGDNAVNSGFGLYMISEIGKRNGDFIISSNN